MLGFIRKRKIFCIGMNKTGTTSLQKALSDLGFHFGDQVRAELLLKEYKVRNFKPVIKYCKTAEAFQDVPFSMPYTFVALDQYFKNAKFILSVRNSSEEWYSSLVKFHSKIFGRNGQLPTRSDLLQATYRYKGYALEGHQIFFNVPDNDLYNRDILIKHYEEHNQAVISYFRFRPNDLLVVNLSDKNAYVELCRFVNRKPLKEDMPWENKTD